MAVPTPSPRGVIPPEWPAQAADAVVETIAKVRDKTTKPAIVAARSLVFGIIAGLVGALAFFLVLVIIVRLWANYVPGHVWVIYAIFAVVFAIAGAVMLRKANLPSVDEPI